MSFDLDYTNRQLEEMIDADRKRLKAFENRVTDLEREVVRLQDQINFLASKDENDDEDDDPDPSSPPTPVPHRSWPHSAMRRCCGCIGAALPVHWSRAGIFNRPVHRSAQQIHKKRRRRHDQEANTLAWLKRHRQTL